jgi:hypothetical protein
MTAAAAAANAVSAIGPLGAAVITPYYKESLEVLERCHHSCLAQEGGWPLRHVMVADGHARPEIDGWDVEHITLPKAHGDNGNTPRCVGAISAINQGYWPILLLDADNWFQPWHLTTVVALRQRHPSADVLAMGRECALPDGTPIPGVPEEDLGLRHVDTSCYVFYPSAFRVLSLWGMMPTYMGPICDRFIRQSITDYGLVMAGTHQPSVVFTAHYSWAYQALDRPVPDDVHDIDWARLRAHFDPEDVFRRTGLHLALTTPASSGGAVGTVQQGSSLSGPRLS